MQNEAMASLAALWMGGGLAGLLLAVVGYVCVCRRACPPGAVALAFVALGFFLAPQAIKFAFNAKEGKLEFERRVAHELKGYIGELHSQERAARGA